MASHQLVPDISLICYWWCLTTWVVNDFKPGGWDRDLTTSLCEKKASSDLHPSESNHFPACMLFTREWIPIVFINNKNSFQREILIFNPFQSVLGERITLSPAPESWGERGPGESGMLGVQLAKRVFGHEGVGVQQIRKEIPPIWTNLLIICFFRRIARYPRR